MSENKAKNSSVVKDALILFAITLIAAFLLAIVNEITKGPIEEAEKQVKAEAYNAVFEGVEEIKLMEDDIISALEGFDEVLSQNGLSGVAINEAGKAYDSEKNVAGYVITVTSPNGYGGDISLAMGITTEGKITCISFVTLNETASLGMEADKPEFKDQFKDREAAELTVTKSETPADNEITAISSATITSKAVTEAVNAGILFVRERLIGK